LIPPLVPLHPDAALIPLKLASLRKLSNGEIVASLAPGSQSSLKARPSGLMLDGHHRIKVLRERGFDVDSLPRDSIDKPEVDES